VLYEEFIEHEKWRIQEKMLYEEFIEHEKWRIQEKSAV